MGDERALSQALEGDEVPSGTLYDYSQHTVKQLKTMLDKAGVKYKSSDLKPALIELAEINNVNPNIEEGGET